MVKQEKERKEREGKRREGKGEGKGKEKKLPNAEVLQQSSYYCSNTHTHLPYLQEVQTTSPGPHPSIQFTSPVPFLTASKAGW